MGPRYHITFPRPGAHLIQVRLEFAAPADGSCRVWMAAWTPGSYLVREYARNVREVAAEVGGKPAEIGKPGKDTWEVAVRAGQRVCIDYSVYAHELSVRTAHHDSTHAFLHPAQIFLVPAEVPGPYEVEVALPDGWTGVSLAADPDRQERSAPGSFTVELADLDELLDTPIEVGRLHLCDLPEPATHVRVAVWGDPLPTGVLRRLAPVVAEVEATWPTRPYGRYTFLVHAVVGAVGGLEHLHGSVLGLDPETLALATRRDEIAPEPTGEPGEAHHGLHDFLELAAHEMFHAWNGKRLRPAALGPFDYHRENFTRELWLVEGVTSYYDRLLVLRAGQMPVQVFLERTAADLARLAATPGRLVQSLAASSFDAWIKLYRPQDDSPNASVSYYLKGALVAWQIDLWLRSERPDGDGLDGVLADLWTSGPGKSPSTSELYKNCGFDLGDFIHHLSHRAGIEPPDWLRAMWASPGELDLRGLAAVGLKLTEKPGEPGAVELGLVTQDRGGATWIQHVLAGSPAEAAGAAAGDELLAARRAGGEWLRVRTTRLARVLAHLRPDADAELLLARRERVLAVGLRPGPARGAPRLERDADAPESARTSFQRWTKKSWNES